MASVGCSDLPEVALDEIARRSGPLDNVICSAVCKAWRRALDTTRFRGLEQPNQAHWAYLHSDYNSLWRVWRPNPKEKKVSVTVSHIARDINGAVSTVLNPGLPCPTRIIGYSCNWVVVVDEACGLSLLEPLTGRRFPLPPITSSRGRSKKLQKDLEQMGEGMFQKAAVAPGRRLGTYAVMLIHSGGHGLSFLAPGAKSWTTLSARTSAPRNYLDAIFHKGAFYTVGVDSQLDGWVPDRSSTGVRAVLAATPQMERVSTAKLVESRTRDVLLMESTTKIRDWEETSKVWRYDEHSGRWVEVLKHEKTLGRNKTSFCISRRGSHMSY
jgi:hypothetical protein